MPMLLPSAVTPTFPAMAFCERAFSPSFFAPTAGEGGAQGALPMLACISRCHCSHTAESCVVYACGGDVSRVNAHGMLY